MSNLDFTVTFACYNQIEYTRKCIESMVKHGLDLHKLVIVDNASTDETPLFIKSLPLGGCILNKSNLGCGVAWNQGALELQSEWTIIMNNDVIVSNGWIQNLIEAAIKNNLKVISPAMIEGELDYDFDEFASMASKKMKDAIRIGGKHAVCLAVHKSVWLDIGYFQPIPKLLGYEDTMFFHELQKAGIQTGITGASWLHHYGSITQSAMKKERGLTGKDRLPYRYNYRLLQQNWVKRKILKIISNRQKASWREVELAKHGITLHGTRVNSNFSWE